MAESNSSNIARKTIAIIPKVVGVASIIGSSYIITSLLKDAGARREKMRSTFNRFLLTLSILDIVSSFGLFLSTWAVPNVPPEGSEELVGGTSLDYDYLFPFAAGTRATCSFQGFLIQAGGIGSVLFTGFISIQYVVSVRYQWTHDSMKKLEKVCFAFGLLIPILSAIYLTATNQFNVTSSGYCSIFQYPYICEEAVYATYDDDGTIQTFCESFPDHVTEEETFRSQMLLAGLPVFLVLWVVIISMLLLYCTVRNQERRTSRWSSAAQEGKYQKKVAVKAMLFIGNYLVMYLPLSIMVFLYQDDVYSNIRHLVAVFFSPIQGVLNAFVFSGAAERMLFFACCCCSSSSSRRLCWDQRTAKEEGGQREALSTTKTDVTPECPPSSNLMSDPLPPFQANTNPQSSTLVLSDCTSLPVRVNEAGELMHG